jgi:hypothetical protein
MLQKQQRFRYPEGEFQASIAENNAVIVSFPCHSRAIPMPHKDASGGQFAGKNFGVHQRAHFDGSGIFFRLDFILFSRACALIWRTEKECFCTTWILALARR